MDPTVVVVSVERIISSSSFSCLFVCLKGNRYVMSEFMLLPLLLFTVTLPQFIVSIGHSISLKPLSMKRKS
jgi:hypothetical protein